MELTLNVIISFLAGVVAGIHSGVVVARMAKFEELRNQIKRVIWSIDYFYSLDSPPRVNSQRDVSELLYLSSDLYALKHLSAGDKASSLSQSVSAVLYSPPTESEEMDIIYLEWQKICRELKPNLRVIFSLRPWV